MMVPSSGAGLAVAEAGLAGISREFREVLTGVALDGAAARLARMLDRAFLVEAGRASAAGPGSVPGRWVHDHRPRRARWRVLSLLHAADRAGADQGSDRGHAAVAAAACPGHRVRGARVPV